MDLFFNAVKGQFNTLNFLLFLLLIGVVLLRMKKSRAARILFIFCVLFFAVSATGYLPGFVIQQMENQYRPFQRNVIPNSDDVVYVHALGGGYTADERLAANSQLSYSSLGRMTEAIRIANLFEKSILVLSGPIASGEESLAAIERRAAIQLGFDSLRIRILEKPVTTQEEAAAFADRFGKDVRLVVVTDAIHMPRAMRFFKALGIDAFPAPTNYLIKKDNNPISLRWIPSVENFLLMDRLYREWLGGIKGYFFG